MKIKLSALAAEVNGTLGGSVFKQSGQGLVLQNRKRKPVQMSQKMQQNAIRISVVSSVYKTLPPFLQEPFEDNGRFFPSKNVFGDNFPSTGFNRCVQRYINTLEIGAFLDPISLSKAPLTISGNLFTFISPFENYHLIVDNTQSLDYNTQILASVALNPRYSANSKKIKFTEVSMIEEVPGGFFSTVPIPNYLPFMGPGDRVLVRIKGISKITGQATPYIYKYITIT